MDCRQVHAPLEDPVPSPPQWAGVANYKTFRKQRLMHTTAVPEVPDGAVLPWVAADVEQFLQ